jgi:hypothetical protein
MLLHAGFYNTYIAVGLSVLHDLTMFMPQALCDEHPAMLQLGWCSTLHDGRCSTSRVATCRTALQHVVSLPVCSWAVSWRLHRFAGPALLLFLPVHIAALTAIDNGNLKTATMAWVSNPATAKMTYGPIVDWNTAAVTSLDQECTASAQRAQRGGRARSV